MIITPLAATASFPAQPWRGTDGSNPLRSSGESANFRFVAPAKPAVNARIQGITFAFARVRDEVESGWPLGGIEAIVGTSNFF